jgi:amino acid adenylation domain-containing protein
MGMTAGEGSVAHMIAARAAARPEAVALASVDETLTYGDLERRAGALARRLQALGVGPEVTAAVVVPRSPAMAVGALAALKAGGAFVPLDPGYPAERLAFMLGDAAPRVVLTEPSLAGRLPAGPWETITLGGDAAARGGEPVLPDAVDPGQLAYVVYTSGSTGWPKGVEIAHRGLANLVAWHRRAFAVTAADRATQVASPGFDAAVWELWPYLTAGASVHFPDEATRLDPEALRDWIIARGITIGFLPTPLAERMVTLPWPRAVALRTLLTGGDTLHRYPPADLPFAVVNNYGPSETTVVATSGRVPPGPSGRVPPGPSGRVSPGLATPRLPTIGRPISGVEIHVLDENGRPVAAGEPGELYIGGAGLGRGYRGRPDLTAERFVPHPAVPGARLYRTGDLARVLADGEIAFVGRADDQIKIRGHRIEPHEIVAALDRHPQVVASAVHAHADAGGERRLVAYVVPADGETPGPRALLDALGASLPDYMLPTAFVRLPALPLTASGKVDRAALPPPDACNTLRDGAFERPRTLVEERVAGILATLLGAERVSVNDNFFLLGGHSLLGTQVIARVRDTFGVDMPLRSLFETPTVEGLAAAIERAVLAKLETSGRPRQAA